MFRNTTIPGKGEGLIAARNIYAGDLILAESPLPKVNEPPYSIADNAAFSSLDDDQMELCLGLQCSSNFFQRSDQAQISGYTWDARHDPTKRRWTHYLDGRIFIQGSRLNHSCDPNSYYSWNPSTGHGRFYAVRNITPGEELTISYLPFSTWKKATRQRLLLLDTIFHAHVSCAVIALVQQQQRKS
jgi:hypothetical protein